MASGKYQGTFKLLPPDHNFKSLADDYQQMQVMFYGEIPAFDHLIETLLGLEDEINAMIFTADPSRPSAS